MQKRFWLKTYDEEELPLAYEEKKRLLKENPDRVYQVRKGRDGGNIVFRLVERLTAKEVKALPTIKKGKSRESSAV